MLYDDRKAAPPALPKVVQVRREHIQEGEADGRRCMVALALMAAGYTHVTVGHHTACTRETGYFKLAPQVVQAIRQHDRHDSRLWRRMFIRPFEVQVP